MKEHTLRTVFLFLLCMVGPRPLPIRAAEDDVWNLRLVDRDGEGVTIEFQYRFESRNHSSDAHVLAYPLPRFEGVEWSLDTLRRGTGTARIRMLCRNAPAPPLRTERVHIYMNDHGNVFFERDIHFPIQWNCQPRGSSTERAANNCPSFRVSFRGLRLDSTTAYRAGVEFPVDWVTVTVVVSNIGKIDTGREFVLRTELTAGGSSARGSIPADGIIFRLSRLRTGADVPYKFRDAFYHGEERRYRAFVAPSPDLSASEARRIKACLETNHATLHVDENKLHEQDLSRRPAASTFPAVRRPRP